MGKVPVGKTGAVREGELGRKERSSSGETDLVD